MKSAGRRGDWDFGRRTAGLGLGFAVFSQIPDFTTAALNRRTYVPFCVHRFRRVQVSDTDTGHMHTGHHYTAPQRISALHIDMSMQGDTASRRVIPEQWRHSSLEVIPQQAREPQRWRHRLSAGDGCAARLLIRLPPHGGSNDPTHRTARYRERWHVLAAHRRNALDDIVRQVCKWIGARGLCGL